MKQSQLRQIIREEVNQYYLNANAKRISESSEGRSQIKRKQLPAMLPESIGPEAAVIHSMTRAGQDAVQNFIMSNDLAAAKIIDYLKRNPDQRYNVRDLITGAGVGAQRLYRDKMLKLFGEVIDHIEYIDSEGENVNEAKNKFKITDFPEGSKILFNDGEEWIVVKKGMRGSGSWRNSDEITIKPFNKLAKDKNISLPIDINLEFLNANTKSINEADHPPAEDSVIHAQEPQVNEAARVPSNILDFAKRKGSYATALVKKAATWAEKAGKRISGGTAIGKNYSTIVLDMKHQGSEIYISLNKETIELFGEEVTDAKSFARVLAAKGK